ncbi:MAG: hypothetical protein ACXWB9_11245 [Flavisolibacter sp.]
MAGQLKKYFRYFYRRIYQKLHYDTVKVLINQARLLAAQNINKNINRLEETEFQVFSQRGEDGIIQYLCSKLDITEKIFIELGVEDYTESNTRLLLVKDNWRGLVVDGNKKDIAFIMNDPVYWKYSLTAAHHFITRENVETILSGYTQSRDIGLLSIDIDGNDFWIWEAVVHVRPAIVVCEYNALWGADQPLTIPYDPGFQKSRAHFSDLYYGCSLSALCGLAEKKGYDFVGTSGAGINAFFVRRDLVHSLPKLSAREGYHVALHQDGLDRNGKLNFLPYGEKLKLLKDCLLVHTETGVSKTIAEWFEL